MLVNAHSRGTAIPMFRHRFCPMCRHIAPSESKMAQVWDAELGGSREHVLREDVDVLMGRGNVWVSGQLKSILGVGQKGVLCKKRMDRS